MRTHPAARVVRLTTRRLEDGWPVVDIYVRRGRTLLMTLSLGEIARKCATTPGAGQGIRIHGGRLRRENMVALSEWYNANVPAPRPFEFTVASA